MGTQGSALTDRFGRAIVPVDYDPAGDAHDVSFLLKNASTPSTLYIERDDSLLIVAATSQTNEVITFNLRIMTPDGRIQDNQFVVRPANTRAVTTQAQTLAEGYLLSLSAIATVAVTRGQTFARCMIVRSGAGIGGAAQMLFADYVTTFVTSGYPNGRILAPTEGPGLITTRNVAAPAAGVDWSVQPPTNARWRIVSWSGLFVASATVANRQVAAFVSSVPGSPWIAGPLANITAGQSANVSAAGITPYVSVLGQIIMLPLPPQLILTNGAVVLQTMGVQTVGLQVGDQWTNINLLIEEWLDNV